MTRAMTEFAWTTRLARSRLGPPRVDVIAPCRAAIWCALCAELIPLGARCVRRPFGRDGGAVWCCADCDGLHPRSGRYAYSKGDGALTKPAHDKGRLA